MPKALAEALDAAKANPHPMLLAVVGWAYGRSGDSARAREWAQRALDQEPLNLHAAGVMQAACGEQADFACSLKYRKFLGMDTHLPRKN
jgi:hypothetical protein